MDCVIAPCTVKAARRLVYEWHRHLPELQGGLFAARILSAGQCVGVAVAGNPCRVWQDTGRIFISRVATIDGLPCVTDSQGEYHAYPGCTKLYAALCRASRALGYREAWTYTLPGETGRSLKAAGFVDMGLTDGGEYDRPSRARKAAKHPEPKRRCLRLLTEGGRK
jgi:hypothetical protein